MLKWALIFFIVAIVAALFGFTGIAAAAAGIAKILFFIFNSVLHLYRDLRGLPRIGPDGGKSHHVSAVRGARGS